MYDYRKCKYIKREINKMVLSEKIRYYFDENDELYGSRRLSSELRSNGTRASHTIVAKYMRQLGLRSKFYPKYRVTTDSKHNNPVAGNLLDRDFIATEPNKV